jgi:hypothetical protein
MTSPSLPNPYEGIRERIPPRLRAVWDLKVAEIREYAGVHDYDGEVQDLSPSGLSGALARLGGDAMADPHDEAALQATENGLRAIFRSVELHRSNPLEHLANLDVACYDREYAPPEERAASRARHLAHWPDAVDASLESLDRIPAPVARATVAAARGLTHGVDDPAALGAAVRLVAHLEQAIEHGPSDCALGEANLTLLLGEPEGMSVDLARLEGRADRERNRLRARLAEDCDRYRPGATPGELLPELLADHPADEEIYTSARELIEEITAFTLEADLIPDPGGECRVGPAPESRRWAMAMMSPGGPYEAEAPGLYQVNLPDRSWPEAQQEEWRQVFSATTLPAITAHEVTPGHFAHGRLIRRIRYSGVRRSLGSAAFVEGWAHYAEELLVEAGFRSEDPRYAIGVWVEALLRVTRLAAALGIHRGTMTVDEATRRFEEDAFLKGPAARAEAERGTFDPTYGRYTWGKLEILALRDEAMASWGTKYTHRRFHDALLELGSPPLGTIGDALSDVS